MRQWFRIKSCILDQLLKVLLWFLRAKKRKIVYELQSDTVESNFRGGERSLAFCTYKDRLYYVPADVSGQVFSLDLATGKSSRYS